MDTYIDLAALGKVLLVSLVAGVGLVSLFGVGLVGLSEYRGRRESGPHSGGGSAGGGPAWLVVAGVSFAVVVLGAALGVFTILE
jgi:hypothetical protein